MMDEARFKAFYEATSKPLLAYLVKVTRDKAMADDVFQESYIRMLQNEPEDRENVKLRSYLFTTATNLVRDHWRRAKRTIPWENEGTGDLPSLPIDDEASLRIGFEEAFGKLSPQQRSLLWLAYVEGYAHKEIAAMVNVKEKSVKVLLFRARSRISTILNVMGLGKGEEQ